MRADINPFNYHEIKWRRKKSKVGALRLRSPRKKYISSNFGLQVVVGVWGKRQERRKLVANNVGQDDFWLSIIFLSFLITALLSRLFFVIGESTVIEDRWSPIDKNKDYVWYFKKHRESKISFAYIKITWINEYREYYLFLLILENQWNRYPPQKT